MTGGQEDIDRVRVLREALTATGAGIYLATHVAGPLPAPTLTAVHESDELELRIGRVGPDRAEDLEQREWEARAAAAAVIKAPFEQVMLAHGTAEAARAITLELLSRRRVHGPGVPAAAVAHTARAARAVDAPAHPTLGTSELGIAEPGTEGSGTGDRRVSPGRVLIIDGLPRPVAAGVESVAAALDATVERISAAPRILATDVALVVTPHVDPVGRVQDLAGIAAAAHRVGACLLVDGSLSVGALPVDVLDLAADALVADVRHWLLGPEGVAVAWLSPTLGEDLPARLRTLVDPFARGTLLSLARSVGWLLMYLDLPWVVARTGRLARRLYGSLASVHGVELLAGRTEHAALLAFRIAGWDAEQAADELSRSASAILDADGEADVIRVSVGAWNREDELDRFIERVAVLAAHSPATLPRRPSLTVLYGPRDSDG